MKTRREIDITGRGAVEYRKKDNINMKKLGIFLLLLSFSRAVFSDEKDVAKQYIDDNALLANYSVLELNFNIPNTKTFLFFVPYNNRQPALNDAVIPFTDGVIIKINNNGMILQYLIINKNGLVRSNDNVIFYDFSEKGYSHIKFNGWLYEKTERAFGINNPNCFRLELTNDGIRSIPADPPLPLIMWDFELNYPVKYEMNTISYPPVLIIEFEWREDIKISVARTGLRDNDICTYLDRLSAFDKRVIINAMFALRGYEFKTTEWINYFSKFLWYKPDKKVINNAEILDKYQRKLFEYLSPVSLYK